MNLAESKPLGARPESNWAFSEAIPETKHTERTTVTVWDQTQRRLEFLLAALFSCFRQDK